ncbi:FecCD family ABC transporter permease [Acerihabitans arboris]|uniref:Iron chelate uptake ABC transporter family permease subunit n=1 Tax=Acerihabitans arboris TaxID=2691583 RepID=A0A845SE93_9GAMM|nr:iron ABC transporter permease [Acerihabitans arboris]NDL62199.1 iron chelate uptake ABC transporter family permease subunit [Acerihabitans arboris]
MRQRGRGFALILTAALLALVLMGMANVVFGSTSLTPDEILSALGLGTGRAEPMVARIILEIRLPRSLLAMLTGAGLAMVGALLQTTTRNDLADPFLFGLSSGASAGAVAVMTRLGDRLGDWALPVAAFVGGVVSALAVILLFLQQKSRGAARLVLSGLAVSFLFGALTNFLVFSGDQRAASSILFWSLGGLGLARWDNIGFALAGLCLLGALAALRWRSLDALLAGEQSAVSMGINVTVLRIEVFLCCAFATALFVALTGVIGFIGLMVPHLARPLAGVRHRCLLPLVAVLGALLMSAGDLLSRCLLAPQELPIGIITAGVGAVFVLALLIRKD